MSAKKEYINSSMQKLFDSWSYYIKEQTPPDYEWHDASDIYKFFGFEKVRYNKGHPHTIDLMKDDSTTYYAVYPTNVTTKYDSTNNENIEITFTFNSKQAIADFDIKIEVK